MRFQRRDRHRDFLHRGLGSITNVESHKNLSLVGLRGVLVAVGKNSVVISSRGRSRTVPRHGGIYAFNGVYALDDP